MKNFYKVLLSILLISNISFIIVSCSSKSKEREQVSSVSVSQSRYLNSDTNNTSLDTIIAELEKAKQNADDTVLWNLLGKEIKFYKYGDILYRRIVSNLDKWTVSLKSGRADLPRVYDCYMRNDTVLEVMREYSCCSLVMTEVFVKNKKHSNFKIIRYKGKLEYENFDDLIGWIDKHKGDSKAEVEGLYDHWGMYEGIVDVYIKEDDNIINYIIGVCNDTIFRRVVEYPKHLELECGVAFNQYIEIYDSSNEANTENLSEIIQSRLNKELFAGIEVKPNKKRAIVKVEVNADGTVRGAKVIRSVHPVFDAEIERVCKELARLDVKRQNGRIVPYSICIPVYFVK